MRTYIGILLLLSACGEAKPRRIPAPLPPIPTSVWTPVGRAAIAYQAGMQESDSAVGKFDWPTRTITLDSALVGTAAWLTIEHERVHLILMDAGVMMDEDLEERICDAIAAARVAQMIRER